MNRSRNLRVPGPTPVPDVVARSGARPMVNHRGPEFASVMAEVTDGLKPFFGTREEPLLLTGSGTGAQEAVIVNMLSPGDEVLSLTAGVFADRFADIAEAFGAQVHRVHAEWGSAITPEDVGGALQEHGQARAVLITHNETSTGVTHDLESLAAVIRRQAPDALILVDGVSSIGAIPFQFDRWDVDVAITGSQKAWMSPPGLAMIAVSERAWEAYQQARMPRFYWDLGKARKNAGNRTTPFTPAVGVIHALQESLRLMAAEGPENVFARHRRLGHQVREGMAGLGLELFADASVASDTVTAVRVPSGVESSSLLRTLREQEDVVVASGQEWLKGSIFRVGHMGWVHDEDVRDLLEALERALSQIGWKEAI